MTGGVWDFDLKANMAIIMFGSVQAVTEKLMYDGLDDDRETALFAVAHLREMIDTFCDKYHRLYDAQSVSLKSVK